MTAPTIRLWVSAFAALSVITTTLVAGATAGQDLVIDGAILTNACLDGGISRDAGRACEYAGLKTFNSVVLKNGAVIYVTNYDNNVANKSTRGNFVLKSLTSISIDKTSRITAKGDGYQGDVCNDGPGPAGLPLAGGRGGCSVNDSGGGGAHFGRGGKGTKDCFIFPGGGTTVDVTCTFPNEWEESCGTKSVNGMGVITCNATALQQPGSLTCYGSNNIPAGQGDALPDVSGQSYIHHILDVEFGAAGGDKGCRDGVDALLASGNGGGRIVLFAANATSNGTLNIDGRVISDGRRGCASGNDSAGGGAGGTVLLVGDIVNVGPTARITARGGRGGDSQPKGLFCNVDADCRSTYNGSAVNGQFCRTFIEPASGNTYKRCDPSDCTPARVSPAATPNSITPCNPGYTKVTLGGDFGAVCIPDARNPINYTSCASATCGAAFECLDLGGPGMPAVPGKRCVPKNEPICDYLDYGDTEEECRNTQNQGTCDDCAGGGGGGIINVQSRVNNIDPKAIFDVRGGNGGICPICAGEAGAGAGELQIDAAYLGEICDGKDNNFDGTIDEGLGTITCPDGSTPAACVGGVPATCPTVTGCGGAVTDTRPRFAVVLDTSGSMLLDSAGTPHFGDGSQDYPGVNGNQTRLFTAKAALSDVLAAFPESDYALSRYYQDVGLQRSCQTANWFECAKSCCSYDDQADNTAPVYPSYYPDAQCVMSQLYPPLTTLTSNINIGWPNKTDCINYAGSCGPPQRGAQYLVDFGQPLPNYLKWLDNKETNFLPTVNCAGGDCELRATGPTPLASSLQATLAFLQPRIACDNAVPCRKYNTILLTDGAESCQGNPAAAAAQLNAGIVKMIGGMPVPIQVKTYVIGFSVLPTEQAQLNTIAASGGTGTAFFVSTRSDLANALATIVSGSFVFEKCNNLDDDCDSLIDEDFPDKGSACDDGLLGLCRGTGVKICKADGSGTMCSITTPGQASTAEVCNGLDDNCNGFVDEGINCGSCVPLPETCDGVDNDCDGLIDEPGDLVDVNKPCGSSIGQCLPGHTVCNMGTLDCVGQTGPVTELCNKLDDNCDGIIDGITQACYSGPTGTIGVGVCHGGVQRCVAINTNPNDPNNWGPCTGEVKPTAEICDGLDNDCNGQVDDGVAAGGGKVTGDVCCPAGQTTTCGVGQCQRGTYKCAGNIVVCDGAGAPSQEVCDGVDNDCNGQTDDIPGLGQTCLTAGGCSGTWVCTGNTRQLVCQPTGSTGVEICNGIDDDCDGQIDETDDVTRNDPTIGVACGAPVAPHDQPPCKAGITACVNGSAQCQGAVGPNDEICDGLDNDCDGVADTLAPCPGRSACVQGMCAEECGRGEFPCGGGFSCQAGYCIPDSCDSRGRCPAGKECQGGTCVPISTIDGGSTASGGSTSSGAGGDTSSSGGAEATGGGTGTGGNAASSNAGGSSSGVAGSGPPGKVLNKDAVIGLATGGGGCACRMGTTPDRRQWLPLLAVFALGLSRIRRSARSARRVA